MYQTIKNKMKGLEKEITKGLRGILLTTAMAFVLINKPQVSLFNYVNTA